MVIQQFRTERKHVFAGSVAASPTVRPGVPAPPAHFRRTQRVLAIVLLALLIGCEGPRPARRTSYLEPTSVSGRVTFARGKLPAETEIEHLRNAHTNPGLLRRAWLELQLHRPQAALDTAATVLYASEHVSAQDESFARYLRAEAYRLQGHSERGDYDLERARQLALDPELQRRLLPHTMPPQPTGKPWGRLAVQPRSTWGPQRANRGNLDPMKRIRRVTIHHSAMYFRSTQPRAAAGQIARIQREHMGNRGYGDIGYHFLIDPSGRVWEGRELRYQGAHASGSNNVGNIGICLLGNFVRQRSGQGPTTAQVRSMEQLVVQLMQRYRFGGEALYCHSDFKNTQCPGPRMRPLVRQFARQLKSRGIAMTAGARNVAEDE